MPSFRVTTPPDDYPAAAPDGTRRAPAPPPATPSTAQIRGHAHMTHDEALARMDKALRKSQRRAARFPLPPSMLLPKG